MHACNMQTVRDRENVKKKDARDSARRKTRQRGGQAPSPRAHALWGYREYLAAMVWHAETETRATPAQECRHGRQSNTSGEGRQERPQKERHLRQETVERDRQDTSLIGQAGRALAVCRRLSFCQRMCLNRLKSSDVRYSTLYLTICTGRYVSTSFPSRPAPTKVPFSLVLSRVCLPSICL